MRVLATGLSAVAYIPTVFRFMLAAFVRETDRNHETERQECKKNTCRAEVRKLYQQIQMTEGKIIAISYAKSDRVRFP